MAAREYHIPFVLGSLMLFMLNMPSFAHAEPLKLTLDKAIQISLDQNLEVRAQKAAINAADANRKQMRGHYGPSLSVDANVMIADKASEMSLGGSGGAQLPAPQTVYEGVVSELVSSLSEPTVIQEQVTSEVNVQLTMPLNNLYQIHQGYQVAKSGLKAAKQDKRRVEHETVYNVVSSYYGVLQAGAQVETAQKAVEHLAEQARVVQDFVTQGLAARNDKLKMDVALRDAKQTLMKMENNRELALAALVIYMGLEPDAQLDLEPVSGDPLDERTLPPFENVLEQAVKNRPELKKLTLQLDQAKRGENVAIADMFPSLALVGTYRHAEGSKMGESDLFIGGLALQWDAWEWGATYYGIDKAQEQKRQANLMSKHATRLVQLEARQAYLNLKTALDVVKVALAAVDQARESYQIESLRFQKGMGTTADILDAQQALTGAENNLTSAVYQSYVAKAALLKALGEPIRQKAIQENLI